MAETGNSSRTNVRSSGLTLRWRVRPILGAFAALLLPVTLSTWPGTAMASAAHCSVWTGVPPPSPGAVTNTLGGVTALSSCNVWAVGLYQDVADGPIVSLAEHWNGRAWTVVPTPDPDADRTLLEAVSGTSSSRVWAVGLAGDASLILLWNGTDWARVASPSPSNNGNDLSGVAAVSGADVWAVGQFASGTGAKALVLHWDGHHWARNSAPAPANTSELSGVAAISARNIWAVGSFSTASTTKTLIEHWNGKKWAHVPSPNPPNPVLDVVLDGVTATSPSDVWAVGSYTSRTGDKTLIEHWNGRAWKPVASPNPGASNDLFSVTASSATSALAVGTYVTGARQKTLVVRWNGRAWTRVPSPSPGQANELASVAGNSASDIWAVGFADSQVLATHCC
ncbi:MAG TPA: hypothetical protein VEV63_08740 [Streptosporangiaceae bacterium]|nr:hypothetical protein [Streptosporangiaceae bacterium]